MAHLGFFRKNNDISTPKPFYDALNARFGFDFDPCPLNHDFDGLQVDWGEMNFVNPPFSQIGKWLQKAIFELECYSRRSVFLVTVRTTSKYWQKYVIPFATRIVFLSKCMTFENYEGPLPVALCLVFFGFDPLIGKPLERKLQFTCPNGEVFTGYRLDCPPSKSQNSFVEI